MAKKKPSKPALRKELDELFALICDKMEIAGDHNGQDAVSLEELAHLLEGIASDCNKAADVAGALAFAIDPKVDEKI